MAEAHRVTRASDLRSQLAERGYFHVRGANTGVLVEVLEALGRVLHVEEIVIAGGSASLVKSDRAAPRALGTRIDHGSSVQASGMPLTLLEKYSRGEICEELSAPYSERAVILGTARRIAIVINESGRSWDKTYYNELRRGIDLEMQGRDDELGDVLESGRDVMLFFRYDKTSNDVEYTYEGLFEFKATQPVTMIRIFKYKPTS